MTGWTRRNPFVGRGQELARLRAAFDDVASGRGSLVVVVGEPGIGKTSLCTEFANQVTQQGGFVLSGHCYEGDRSLPYLPFIEALRPYVLEQDESILASDLGAGAKDIARLLPEVRDRLRLDLVPDETAGPDEARYRLFEAVSTLLRNIGGAQPLLLLLEDLHDADRGTFDLLTHVVRRLAGSRILVAGTYRDIEVDRAHPLSAALAELRRSATLERIHLRGLQVDEVQELLDGIAQEAVSAGLARAVHGQTEGNPLFAQEVGRYLADEQLLLAQGERAMSGGGQPALTNVPEGLRDVIGRRLSRLSPDCNRLLGVAAVIGREFGLSTLQAVSETEESALLEAMEQAIRAGIVEDASTRQVVRFQFTHALFRQTLYEEILTPRRLRLHQRIAHALESDYGANPEQHAAELAEHFAQSNDPADLAKGVAYSEQAAHQAISVYAYGEAARHLTQALEVQEALDPNDKTRRCDLLLALADTLLPAGEPLRVIETVAPEALALAEALTDRARASRTCQCALRALLLRGGGAALGSAEYRWWTEQADQYAAAPQSFERVYTDLGLSNNAASGDEKTAERWDLVQRVLTLARELDNAEALFQCGDLIAARAWPVQYQEERLRIVEELAVRRRDGVSLTTLGSMRLFSFRPFIIWGDRDAAEAALREAKGIAERIQDSSLIVRCAGPQIALAGIDGRLEEAVLMGEQLRLEAEDLGVPGLGRMHALLGTLWPLLYLGRAEVWLEALAEYVGTTPPEDRLSLLNSGMAVCFASLARWDEVHDDIIDLRRRLEAGSNVLDLPMRYLADSLALAVLLQDRDLTRTLRERLADASHLVNDYFPTCIARHLGAASALLGEREEAWRYYEQALEVCAKIGFRPEIALTHLQMAELLLEDSGSSEKLGTVGARHAVPLQSPSDAQRGEALQHLDFAIAELREMKMQPALERALVLREHAQTAHPDQPASVRSAYPDRLTAREVEILRLVAAGKSNPDIAAEMVLSVHTVERHVANIYTKIGARARAEAIAYALRRQIM